MRHCPSDDVCERLVQLGSRIRTARMRRQWSKAGLASRVGVERRTIARLENGDPGVALGVFLSALDVFGLLDTTAQAVAPEADSVGAFLEQQRQPKRVHERAEPDLDF